MARVFSEYEQRKAGAGLDRLRGPARELRAHVRGGRVGAGGAARAVPRVHRRRVPGREPAAAVAARALARRRRRALRGRRRLPVDLRVHRRVAGVAARARRRFPGATVVRLEENYRSSPQVLALANRLVPQLGGAEKTLRATRADGPEPALRGFDSPEEEGAFVLSRVRELRGRGRAVRGDGRPDPAELALGRLRGAVRATRRSRSRARRCSPATPRGSC